MNRLLEQRYAIKFCVKLGKPANETLDMIRTAFGDDAMGRSSVFEWHKLFREGREVVEDNERSGRPSTSNTDDNVVKVKNHLNSDRRLSVRMIAENLNLPKTVVHRIVTENLAMRKVCAKLVPKVLTDDQKANRMTICQELFDRVRNEPDFLNNVVTGDETWVFEYDPETKRQSSEWHTSASPRPKKARMSKSKMKSMLLVFFDSKGVIHMEFLPAGQVVNATFYVGVLQRLRKRIIRIRGAIANSWKLHHDNAPSHTALVVREYLAQHNVATLPQPPYSPDIAPPDFFLFPRLKSMLKGHRHGTVQAVQQAVTRELNNIPVAAFQKAYQEWQNRWKRCVDAQGCYFEEY